MRTSFCLVAILPLLFLIAPPQVARGQRPVSPLDTSSLSANRIHVVFNRTGSLDYYSKAGGAVWWVAPQRLYPTQFYPEVILFDAGLGVIGKMQDSLRLSLVQWASSYAPGPIIDGKPALAVRPQDSTRYRIYRISRGDTESSNPDYAEWPADLGAPTDGMGTPKLYADQTLWMVYNGADASKRPGWEYGSPFPHFALEIQQLSYAHAATIADSIPLLANVVFIEWTLINRDSVPLDSAYITLWSDVDVGSASSGPAIDTTRQLPYCWQLRDNPWGFPMAAGFVLLRGPLHPSPGDSALFRGRWRPGFKNLQISSFFGIMDDSGGDSYWWTPAYTLGSLWNIARGYDKLGQPVVNPATGSVTKLPYSGDPVTHTGWVHDGTRVSGGSGFNVFFGPLTIAPNDTQWVLAAIVPAVGADRFDAIQVLRRHADDLRAMPYDSLLHATFSHTPWIDPVPDGTILFQNYPNPFNAGTSIGYQLSAPAHVTIKLFDLLGREVMTLVNEAKAIGVYHKKFTLSTLASGVYFYRFEAGAYVYTKKLIYIR